MSSKLIKDCIFCKIIRNEAPSTRYPSLRENILVFKDIHPVSDYHLLAIPTSHIRYAQNMSAEYQQQHVDSLLDAFKNLHGENYDSQELLLGYHKGMWTSVKHAHIHLIYPKSKMSWFWTKAFTDKTWWFDEIKV